MRYTLLGLLYCSASATCAMHCSHRFSSALRRSHAAAPTWTTTACTASGKAGATAAELREPSTVTTSSSSSTTTLSTSLRLFYPAPAPLLCRRRTKARARQRVVSQQPSCVSCEYLYGTSARDPFYELCPRPVHVKIRSPVHPKNPADWVSTSTYTQAMHNLCCTACRQRRQPTSAGVSQRQPTSAGVSRR